MSIPRAPVACLLLAAGIKGAPVAAAGLEQRGPGQAGERVESAAVEAAPPLDRGVLRLAMPLSTMVRIPAGSSLMGSDEPEVLHALADCVREPYGHRCTPTLFGNEMPRHVVQLSSYWIDRFEVRVADYERCVRAGQCGERPRSEATLRFDHHDYPVSRVSWDDARAYCAFRDARLPTEAEFERAARGMGGRRYPWGELFNQRAGNHGRFGWDVTEAADGFLELAPVGSFPAGATPEGVYDLAGNVAEWTSDRYVPSYDAGPVRDPKGPGIGASNLRVVRGGSYAQARFRLRGAARAFAEPSERRSSIGFRCARSALVGETRSPRRVSPNVKGSTE
jgi:formylglycine-generating enzyme required for sulfatase activity